MKLFRAAATALLATAPIMAFAGPVLVNFEKTWDFANGDVNGYYGGGTAADGTSGPNLGVSFVNVSGLSNDPSFPAYSNAPSPIGVAYAHTFTEDDRSFMNMTAAAIGSFSFFYSSPVAVLGAVKAYSGLNGTGNLLGSLNLLANDAPDIYDAWTLATFAFSGQALSFDFTASANAVAFDNVSVTAVPEPSTVLLMLAGGVAALRTATRRRKAAP
jgi:hypothetical protein